MQLIRKNRNRRQGGFTLLEVLLVVGILALLAAFVVPSLMGTRTRAEIDITKGKIGAISSSIEIYRMHMGKYPEELTNLIQKPEDETEAGKWGGPYIEDASKLKDPWDHEIQYKFPGEVREGSYDLWSYGPDGEDGSADDIKNWTSEN